MAVNSIVKVNVNQQIAPTPSNRQQTGALISQGGTTLAPQTYSLLVQPSSLTPLIAGGKTISAATWTANVVTITTAAAHGWTVGDTIPATIAGMTPIGYNGTFDITITTTTQFTYALGSNPGSATVFGAVTLEDVAELTSMATTFFGMGGNQAVYVLELGEGTVEEGVAALDAFITANGLFFYGYIVPSEWDANSAYLAFLAQFQSTTAQTYFFTTTTLATYQTYTDLMKCVVALIEAPVAGQYPANALTAATWSDGLVTATTTTDHSVSVGDYFSIAGMTPIGYNGTFLALTGTTGDTLVYAVASSPGDESVLGTLVASPYASTGTPSTEFSIAAPFYKALNYAPSTTNKVTPFAWSFLYGVTPYPLPGNSAILSTLRAANINVVGTGAEGGISDAMLVAGTTMDGRDFTYWYSVDWVQINSDLNVANEIINGSNDPINPLILNQDGINRIQAREALTMADAVTFGLAIGTITQTQMDGPAFDAALNTGQFAGQLVINAVPFLTYYTENPDDYKIGQYNGLSVVYVPARGFNQIVINVTATDFVTQ